jgi:hypothetical protein
LIKLPNERNWLDVVGFIRSNTSDGYVERYKARLVVKRYIQTCDIDYKEFFCSSC